MPCLLIRREKWRVWGRPRLTFFALERVITIEQSPSGCGVRQRKTRNPAMSRTRIVSRRASSVSSFQTGRGS